MPIAGPSTKTVGPKTGGNGDSVKPIMVQHGTLPKGPLPVVSAACATPPCGSFVETSAAAVEASSVPAIVPEGTLDVSKPGMFLSVDEAAQDCPACCPKPCESTCACQVSAEPMPIAGPSTKTVGPKTGGSGNQVKPVSVPHGTLPAGHLPLVPASCGTSPCGASLLEEHREPRGFVLQASGSSVTIGDTSKPESGETVTKSTPTRSQHWSAPHLVKKGEIETYVPGGWPSSPQGGLRSETPSTASEQHQESQAAPEQHQEKRHEEDAAEMQPLREAARAETQYEERVADVTRAAKSADKQETEEVIHNFVNKV